MSLTGFSLQVWMLVQNWNSFLGDWRMVRCSYFSSFHKLIVVETQKIKMTTTIVLIQVILTKKAIFLFWKIQVLHTSVAEIFLKINWKILLFKPADRLKIWNLSDFFFCWKKYVLSLDKILKWKKNQKLYLLFKKHFWKTGFLK